MSFPVQIEFGNESIVVEMHAIPSKGDRISCSFTGQREHDLFLVVTSVNFHQSLKDRNAPFGIVITTDPDTDPALRKLNEERVAKMYGLQGLKK